MINYVKLTSEDLYNSYNRVFIYVRCESDELKRIKSQCKKFPLPLKKKIDIIMIGCKNVINIEFKFYSPTFDK